MFNFKAKFAVGLLLISLIEVGITIALAKTLGAVTTFSLFAASNIIGLVILWFRWQAFSPHWSEYWLRMIAAQQLSEVEKSGQAAEPESKHDLEVVSVSLTLLFSLILLLIPGLITDLIAFQWIRTVGQQINDIPTLQTN
jgi:UPF0716 family protein affecting phage T7 exclusion